MSTIPDRYERWLIVGLLLLVVIVRLPAWFAPLARDAGVYAFVGQQIVAGHVPYRDVWDHKPPGLYYLFALALALFPDSTTTLRTCELVWVTLTTYALYGLTRRYVRPLPAAGSAALFALAASHSAFSDCGDLTFPETYMLLPTILGIWACQRHLDCGHAKWLAIAGACGGLAFLFKPPAFMWVASAGLYLALHAWRAHRRPENALRPLLLLASGVGAATGIVFLYFLINNALPDFISQVFTYNSLYVHHYLGWRVGAAIERGFVPVLLATPALWLLAMVGLARWMATGQASPARPSPLLIVWLLTDVLVPFSGGKVIPHYFLQSLPALAVLSGWALDQAYAHSRHRAVRTIATLVLVLGVSTSAWQHVWASITVASRCPFRTLPEEAANFIHQRAAPDERIYVWGTATAVYFLAQRTSPTRYAYLYPLQSRAYSTAALEKTLLADLCAHPPAYIVDSSGTNGRIPRLDGSAPGAGSEPMYERSTFPLIADFANSHYVPAATIGPWIVYEYQRP
jgi:4-amino-4-deoxy-L-arabinose transferase-like glycosyltransferase